MQAVEHRRQARARPRGAPPLPSGCGTTAMNSVRSPPAAFSLQALEQLLAAEVLLATTSVDLERQALLLEVDDDVLDGQPGGVVDALDQVAPQPARADGGVRGDDDLVGPALGDRVHRRQERVGVADFAGRLDPLAGDQRERQVDAHLRRFAHRLVVDHEARRGLALRHDQAEAHVALGRARAHGLEQLGAAERAVGDDEDLLHRVALRHSLGARATPAPAPTVAGVGVGAKMPCTAPGHAVLVGTADDRRQRSKLKIGGGEETCHSSVMPRHGLPTRAGRRASW